MQATHTKDTCVNKASLFASIILVGGWASAPCLAAIIYVDGTATGLNNGTSWRNAYTDLADALAVATSGDDIWIAAGTYDPSGAVTRDTFDGTNVCTAYPLNNCASLSSRAKSFVIPTGVDLLGGFSGTETSPTQRILDSSSTILTGDYSRNDSPFDLSTRGENVFQVVVVDGTSGTPQTIDRLTISHGHAYGFDNFFGSTLPDFDAGGGIVILDGEIMLSNVRVVDNSAATAGGGMVNLSSGTVTISDCAFEGNFIVDDTAGSSSLYFLYPGGGAILHALVPIAGQTEIGTLHIFDTTFSSNSATQSARAGAIYAPSAGTNSSDKTIVIRDCVFSGNSGGAHYMGGNNYVETGGTIELGLPNTYTVDLEMTGTTVSDSVGGCAIRVEWGDATIDDCVFQDNSTLFQYSPFSPNGAAALYVFGETLLSNSHFEGNTGEQYGATYIYGSVTDCVFENNTAAGTGSGSNYGTGGAIYGAGQLFVDRCTFTGNSATELGGAIYRTPASIVSNSLFVDNTAFVGGGIYLTDTTAQTKIINCTFAENSAGIGGGIYRDADANVLIANSILWDNTDSVGTLSGQIAGTTQPNLTAEYSLVDDPAANFGGTGMVYSDPWLEDPSSGDYSIKLKSPARESGSNSALDTNGDAVQDILIDILGGARVQGPASGVVDMGMRERCFADLDGSGSVNYFDISMFISMYNASDPDADISPPGGDGMLNIFDLNAFIVIYDNGAPCN